MPPSPRSTTLALASGLRAVVSEQIEGLTGEAVQHGVFTGSGDSLAAAVLCEGYGHRPISSGDLAWYDGPGPSYATLVAISHSGATGATVLAAERAVNRRIDTIAITASPGSPLTLACARSVLIPTIAVAETIPSVGYVMLSLAILALCGADISDTPWLIADSIEALVEPALRLVDALPDDAPHGISILTLPDLRTAGDFWALKLIEATGLPVRCLPLEESGHVDYFIGPQPHVIIQLANRAGRERHAALSHALRANGHCVVQFDLSTCLPQHYRDPITASPVTGLTAVAAGAIGAYVSHEVANKWHRIPFRRGDVNMDASHIQLQEVGPLPSTFPPMDNLTVEEPRG